ncbi:MAG: Lrp/AsnC family transcriptional regulator [Olsenella sp.]|nr:Lrp/AsnC family transcriptional regulator [Olsenella sp.]
MKIRDILRKLIDDSTVWSQNRIAPEVGLSPQAMTNRMKGDRNMKAEFAAQVLDVLGYQLVVVPKGNRLPKGSFVVTTEEE